VDRKVVLVVEDNRDELTIYTTLLSYAGYTILAATDYASAMDIATDQGPDLAIVDVNLGPDQPDGCDLVAELRSHDTTRSMPIIAHTAFGDLYLDALGRAGCDRIIHKPANPARLLEAVRDLIGDPSTQPEQQA
jgi:two-component system, cell cycle response regulator DivK